MSKKKSTAHMVVGGRAKIAAIPVVERAGQRYTTLAFMAMSTNRRHDSMDRSYKLFLEQPDNKIGTEYIRVESKTLDPKCGLPEGRTEVLVPVMVVAAFLRYLRDNRAITDEAAERVQKAVVDAVREFGSKSKTTEKVAPPVTVQAHIEQALDQFDALLQFNALLQSIEQDLGRLGRLAHVTITTRPSSGITTEVNKLITENNNLQASNAALQAEVKRLTLSAHQMMEAGNVPFESLELTEGKVWVAADLRRLGTWFTIQDLYRQYCQRRAAGNNMRHLDLQQFSKLVYWVFCAKLRDAAGVPVPRVDALASHHCAVLRIRIPDANTYARQQHAIRDAVEKKIPVAATANWVPQLWFSQIGVAYLFDKFEDLFHQWERAGFPEHAANRLTRKTPTEDVQSPT